MPKKKVTKNESQELKGFLTYMEYFATGEGLTIEFLLSYTKTPEQAIEKHLDKFVGERKESRDYFSKGIVVHPMKSKKARKLLDTYFKNVDWLYEQLKRGGVEFYLKYYVNHN